MTCPRCGAELERLGTGERWRCRPCRGAAITTADFLRELRRFAPAIVPHDAETVSTDPRRSVAPALACPRCGEPMQTVMLGRYDLDRCYRDEVFWFDDWEHVAIMSTAKTEQLRPGLEGLLHSLFAE